MNGGAASSVAFTVSVTDPTFTLYASATARVISTAWRATLVQNDPAVNLQWSPSAAPNFVDGVSPYNFIDRTHPANPTTPPTDALPLYWGNYYEIRVGIVNPVTSRYCGSTGAWPANGDASSPNGNPVPPIVPANAAGCLVYMEPEDRWVIPAPRQRVPNSATTGGYDTVLSQNTANQNQWQGAGQGALVFTVKNGTGSTLTFSGRPRPSNWQQSCIQPVAPATDPSFPCGRRLAIDGTEILAQRFNPDPQIWVVSATGTTQQPRITAISTKTPALTTQGTTPVFVSQLRKTNDFLVTFGWPFITSAGAVTPSTGNPGQPAITDAVPSCEPTGSFVAFDATGVSGITVFPTCMGGLPAGGTTACTANANNCLYNADPALNAALSAGATWAANLQTASPVLNGIYIAQRPLQLLRNPDPVTPSAAILNAGDGDAASATINLDYGQGSLPFTVSLPLDGSAASLGRSGVTIADNYWNRPAGTASSLTVRTARIIQCPDASCLNTDLAPPNYFADATVGNFFNVSSVTLSASSPSATFQLTNIPRPSEGATYQIFFDVVDSATTTSVYPYYAMPYVILTLSKIAVTLPNFPPTDKIIYVTQTNNADAYWYQVHLERSPLALGLSTPVTVNFQIVTQSGGPAPIEIYTEGSSVPLTAFTFNGYQTTINFRVVTPGQATAGPFSIIFTDPTADAVTFANGLLDLDGAGGGQVAFTNLYVRANPISFKTLNEALVASGPFAGEPFYVEATFSPPAQSVFTITLGGGSAAGGAVNATVPVNSTGVVIGPIVPIPPLNIPISANSYQLPFAVVLTGAGASSYSAPSVVTITVLRHTLVVTNSISAADGAAGTLTVWSSGQSSRQYCISPSYSFLNSTAVTASDSLSITFYSVDATGETIPGLIFSPSVVNITQANPRACVSVRADRNWNWESLGVGSKIDYNVGAYLGGSLASWFQNPLAAGVADDEVIFDFPSTVTVQKPAIQLLFADGDTQFLLGETAEMILYTDVLPPQGVNYTVVASGVLFSSNGSANSTTATGRFTTASQWNVWNVTFTGLAGDIEGPDNERQVQFSLYLSAQDAQFYRATDPNALVDDVAVFEDVVSVVKRNVELVDLPSSLKLGYSDSGVVRLVDPVINGLTVTLFGETTDSAVSQGLVVTPSVFTFLPGQPTSASFEITGNLLGNYRLYASLSGADQDLFDLTDESSTATTVSVVKRDAVVFINAALASQGGIAGAATPAQTAAVAYALDSNSALYSLNVITAEVKAIASDVGPGTSLLQGLAPSDKPGFLYAIKNPPGPGGLELYRVSVADGTTTLVNTFDPAVACDRGLDYDPISGLLYASDDTDFCQINPITFEVTPLPSAGAGVDFPGLAVDPVNKYVYAIDGNSGAGSLWRYSIAFSYWTYLFNTGIDVISGPTEQGGMSWDPVTKLLYALAPNGALFSVDPEDEVVTQIATFPNSAASLYRGLAFGSAIVPGTEAPSTITAGVTYGPVAVTLSDPLLPGEQLVIKPTGSDFVFTPSSVTLTAGQTQALFSFVYLSNSSQTSARIFWQVSGNSAWKYAQAGGLTQDYTIAYRAFDVELEADTVTVGVAHEGFVTLPFAPSAGLTITPVALGGDVTFNPPQFKFDSDAGNVIHFTYTVNSLQAFDLSNTGSLGQPTTAGVPLQIAFVPSGLDAGLYVDEPVVKAIAVLRPQFLLDATYSSGGVVLNSVEQDSGIFVIGKWSQKYSIHLASPPAAGSVTLTITDTKDIVEFEFGSGSSVTRDNTATLTFTADSYLQYFRFRFVNLLSGDLSFDGVKHLSVTVSQPFYDYTAIFGAFDGIVVSSACFLADSCHLHRWFSSRPVRCRERFI